MKHEAQPEDQGAASSPRGPRITRRSLLALGAVAAVSACSPAAHEAAGPSTTSPPPSGTPTATHATGSPKPTTTATPKPTPTGPRGPATEVGHGPRTSTSVALTFHGAGDPGIADRILTAIEQGGGAATVLAVGTWLQGYPAVGRRILSGGHELGNHTLHHRPMRLMDEATAYAEIVGGQREVRKIVTGPSWFRPSGTPHATPDILAAAGRAGYATSLSYDVDALDYTDPGAGVVVSRVLSQARPGSIISLHFGHPGTAIAMPKIVTGLARMGLSPVTVSQLLNGVSP